MNLLKKYDTWSLERVSRHVLYWGVWSVFYMTVNYFSGQEGAFWQFASFELLVLPIKMGCTYVIAYWAMPRFLYQKKYGPFILSVLGIALLFGWLLFMMYLEVVYPYIFGKFKSYNAFGQFVYKAVELIYIAAAVLGIKFFQNYLYEQERNQALQQEKLEAELKYLKNQVQPHFLFNTLNNIYGMVLSNDRNASETIVKLSDMLGYMLYDSNVPLIALHTEIEKLENFIELERLRYDRKLDFRFEKSLGQEDDLYIAPLLLLPFIENAFKHGPAKEEGQSFIHVQAKVSGHKLYFEVENSYNEGPLGANVQSGIGLENIAKRLALLYPDKHKLEIQEEDTFCIRLQLNLNGSA
jgi:two-component system LytT family sensor kinase